MKIKNPETGEVIVIPQGMEDAVRDAIESGNDPMEAMQMKYGGIHINPANKGKFNATKKATGKTTEELTHSKNPLTRKRAIFAQNASRWKHQDGGQAMQQQQSQGGGQEDQMQQLVQMAEQALAQGASPEEVAQMLVQQGVPEQVVQQVIQYAIQDLQQQTQGQNPEEQMQQQNPQEEQAEMRYGGCMECGGKMENGGRFLPKAKNGISKNVSPKNASIKTPFGDVTWKDPRNLESGMIEDKNKGIMYAIKDGKVVKTFPIMTGLNKDGEINNTSVVDKDLLLKTDPEAVNKSKATPTGTYLSTPNPNIYGYPGFNMDPIPAFGQPAPQAADLGQHVIYGLNPDKSAGEHGGYDPVEGARRTKIMQGPGENRVGSYGCTNMYGQDINCLTGELFPQGDTTIVIDSRRPQDQDFMKDKYGIGAGSQTLNQTPIQTPSQPQAPNQSPLGFYTKDFMEKLNEFSKNNQSVDQPPLSFIPRGYNPGLVQNNQGAYNPRTPNQAPAQASVPNSNQRSSQSPNQPSSQSQPSFIPKDFIKNFNEAVQNNQNPTTNKPTSQAPTSNAAQRPSQTPSKATIETPRTAQDVRAIQKTLIENGYKLPNSTKPDGSYDGIFGPETKKALEDFQNKRSTGVQKPGQSTVLPAEFEYGGGIDNPGFRALPDYVQQDIINNMAYGGRFLRKAVFGVYDDNSSYRDNPNDPDSAAYNNNPIVMGSPFGNFQNPLEQYKPSVGSGNIGGISNSVSSSPGGSIGGNNIGGGGTGNGVFGNMGTGPSIFSGIGGVNNVGGMSGSTTGGAPGGSTSGGNIGLQSQNPPVYGPENQPSPFWGVSQASGATTPSGNTKLSSFDKYNKGLANISGGNSYFGRGIQHLGQATFDFTKGGIEMAGNNISNRNALGDEANNLRSAMRNDYKKVGKRPTDGNAIISKYGGRMMQDGGATYADKMKVSKNSPQADFIAEKGEYIVNNGVASKLETGGSHASGNDTAISLDKSSNPSYVLSDTPRLKQLQFGGKRVSPSKYAEMATVEALGKTPDQILKAYTAFTKRAGTEGKVFGDRISDATNQLLTQKYQKDIATVKQIADQAYHKQEQLKHAMGMDNDLDHAQEVNGMSMAKFGGMQDGVHMNYFNAPAVQYGGGPQLFSSPSRLGYNTTQMAYGGLHRMAGGGKTKEEIAKEVEIQRLLNKKQSTGQGDWEGSEDEVLLNSLQKSSPSTSNAMSSGNAPTSRLGVTPGSNRTISTTNPTNPINLISSISKGALSGAQEYQAKEEKAHQDAMNAFNAPSVVNTTPGVVTNTISTKNPNNTSNYKSAVGTITPMTSSGTASVSNSNVSANVPASTIATQASGSNATTATTAANPYSGWKGQTFSTPEGRITPEGVDLNIKPMADWASFAQKYAGKDSRITTKQTPEAIGALQEVVYDEYLDTPQGQEALNKMWLDYGVTNQLEKNYSGIANKIKNKEHLTEDDLKSLRANYMDKLAGKRLPEMLPDAPPPPITPPPITPPPVTPPQEVDKKKLDIETAGKKANYDIPAINAYIPQSYGRNPIGLQLAQAQTIRPAKLNIQSELNEYNRGMRGAFRGTQGNTSVNVAQQMQGLNNLYGAQNKLYGQKYNFDEQSRAGADQFNAQAIMNTDAANIQRIGVNQDAIARREGAIDTQRRTDFQAGIENADKQNAYGLSKQYIESTFGPYLNNEGKLNFAYDPTTGEKINKDKEKSYTVSQINKMTAEERKAQGFKFGGPVKKIKLKLRK